MHGLKERIDIKFSLHTRVFKSVGVNDFQQNAPFLPVDVDSDNDDNGGVLG